MRPYASGPGQNFPVGVFNLRLFSFFVNEMIIFFFFKNSRSEVLRLHRKSQLAVVQCIRSNVHPVRQEVDSKMLVT